MGLPTRSRLWGGVRRGRRIVFAVRYVIGFAFVHLVLIEGERLDEALVRRHPLQACQRPAADPADIQLSVAALRLRAALTRVDTAEKAFHREMEVLVIVFDRIEIPQVRHMDLQLFGKFAHAGVLRRFAALHLAARKLPKSLHIAIAALNGEHLVAIAVSAYDACCHMYRLHGTPFYTGWDLIERRGCACARDGLEPDRINAPERTIGLD